MVNIGENLKKQFSLEGKIVLLTGAAGGIGSELAKGLAGAGAQMALADIKLEPLNKLVSELEGENHTGFELDICDMDSIDKVVADILERYGRIDVLINCAGINKREGYLDVEENTYDRIMNVNLKGLYFLTQKVVLESMMKTGGKIINMASHNSTGMLGGVSVYGATKSAVAALTRSMAIEWAKFNIQANAIAPGHILTALTQITWDTEHRAQYLRERISAERPGNPEELIGITILLASEASSYITGTLINVDGGALAGGKPWQFDTKY
ncbi:MAG: SDR family oxidoreductase [Ruminococcaceae bacterium]|nr:SDR family oxidoreductase [Oscillospiraceae bacterium]